MNSNVSVPWEEFIATPDRFAEVLSQHSFAVLTDCPAEVADACTACACATSAFFDADEAIKRRAVSRAPGNRSGWRINCGGSREQYHIRCEANAAPRPSQDTCCRPYSFSHQPWPADDSNLSTSAPQCAEELRRVAELCVSAALRRQRALAPSPSDQTDDQGGMPISLPCLPVLDGLGPSVLDGFRYFPNSAPGGGSESEAQGAGSTELPGSTTDDGQAPLDDATISLPEHADPGLVTIEARATLPGLEVLDLGAKLGAAAPGAATTTASWRTVESLLRPLGGDPSPCCDLVVMAGERLEAATRRGFRSCRHRVLQPPASSSNAPRDAVVFELRCC